MSGEQRDRGQIVAATWLLGLMQRAPFPDGSAASADLKFRLLGRGVQQGALKESRTLETAHSNAASGLNTCRRLANAFTGLNIFSR
mmetsp:Transcript_76375/g.139666  ORF Transcript_76375/g.139666 Transcript_76375/m.139666 type:complete len:86 (+) Transcript_76375:108-365(+)